MSDLNNIIYGRDNTQRVVSIEVQDSTIELFIENEDGTITSDFRSSKPWILTPKPVSERSIRLQGDLHYKYVLTFDTEEEFRNATKRLYGKDFYCCWNLKEMFMVKTGVTLYKGMKAKEPSILSFDIETTSLSPQDPKAKVLIIANTFRKQGKITRKLFAYNDYDSQAELIDAWCDWVREINPSILLGYNINGFDIPYLYAVAQKNDTSLRLGRNGTDLWFNKNESKFRKDGSQFYTYRKVNVYGREVIDGFFVALRYDVGRKYESYKLKQLIKQEGLEVKDRVFYDGDQIRHKYHIPEEFEKIKQYAQFDGDDALALYDLMIPAFFYMMPNTPKPFQMLTEGASGSQINSMLVRSYLQIKHSIPKASEVSEFQGAISFALPGIYRNSLKIDFAALYPSIIRQFKIYDRDKDPKGHFLQLLEYFAVERLKNKKISKETGDQYYEDLQQAQKILCNSFYGFLSTQGMNFNSPLNAAEITKKGREFLTTSIQWATGKEIDYWLNLFKEKTQ